MNLLEWLQNWYREQCDGDWEHLYGIKIDNIDNPGWMVKIDLLETELEDRIFEKVKNDLADDDWILCFVKNGIFEGHGDINKLVEILTIFKNWVEN